MERKMFYLPEDVARMFEDDNFDEIFLASIAEKICDVDFQLDEKNAAFPLMNKQLELLMEEDIGHGNSSSENGEDAENQDGDENELPSRKRKRKRNENEWKNVVAKKRRALGLEYIGKRYNKEKGECVDRGERKRRELCTRDSCRDNNTWHCDMFTDDDCNCHNIYDNLDHLPQKRKQDLSLTV